MKEPERGDRQKTTNPSPPPARIRVRGQFSAPFRWVCRRRRFYCLALGHADGGGGGKEVAHGRRGCSGLSDIPFIVWQINVRRPCSPKPLLQTRFLFKRAERKREVDLRLGALRKKIHEIKNYRRLYWYTRVPVPTTST